MSTPKLKPCPFCGGTEMQANVDGCELDPSRYLFCPNCGAQGPQEGSAIGEYGEDLLSAEGAWNQRL